MNLLTSGGKSGIIKRDERIVSALKSGTITTKLNEEKQNPHILNTPAYKPEENKSYFTISLEKLQEIVDEIHGTGTLILKKDGQIKEIVKSNRLFGVCVDESTGEPIGDTDEAVIHYSKKRTHIVPKRKEDT